MRDDQPSKTAERAAVLRAAHQLLDAPPILDDRLAERLIPPDAAAALHANLESLNTPVLRALRASVALRSRYAEDRLRDAVARGVSQYVLLGAGLDSFAYRNPFPPSVLRVYEVDHPETQAWKRARLAAAGIAEPAGCHFVGVDFERETIAEAVARGGFDARARTFVSWLGVTVYLGQDAVRRTLAWAASLPAGSEIVFSYATPNRTAGPSGMSILAGRAAALGEPWVTFFEPDALVHELAALGFTDIEDFGPEQAFARYFRQRPDGLMTGRSGHLMRARTGGQDDDLRS